MIGWRKHWQDEQGRATVLKVPGALSWKAGGGVRGERSGAQWRTTEVTRLDGLLAANLGDSTDFLFFLVHSVLGLRGQNVKRRSLKKWWPSQIRGHRRETRLTRQATAPHALLQALFRNSFVCSSICLILFHSLGLIHSFITALWFTLKE